MPTILFTVRLTAGPDVRRALAALVGPTRAQPGCVRCTLLGDVADASAVEFVAEWASREELDRQLRSDDCRRLLAAAERADRAPAFRIDTVHTSEGIEAVAAARGQAADFATRPQPGATS